MILLLEDNTGDAVLFQKALRETAPANSPCAIARDAAEAERMMEGGEFDVVVVDLRLPGMDGWCVLEQLRGRDGVRTVVLTSSANDMDRTRAADLGVEHYLIKPDDFASLQQIVKTIASLDQKSGTGPNY